jgi:hypothetical protein
MALRMVRSYRTVSTDGTIFLASMIPGGLIALERKRVTCWIDEDGSEDSAAEIKSQERAITIEAW